MAGDYEPLNSSRELLHGHGHVRLCTMLSPLFCMIKKLEGV